jgi:hypothetical protein
MEIATRHSIFCILPPHILIAIAKNAATPEQRASAVDALISTIACATSGRRSP